MFNFEPLEWGILAFPSHSRLPHQLCRWSSIINIIMVNIISKIIIMTLVNSNITTMHCSAPVFQREPNHPASTPGQWLGQAQPCLHGYVNVVIIIINLTNTGYK